MADLCRVGTSYARLTKTTAPANRLISDLSRKPKNGTPGKSRLLCMVDVLTIIICASIPLRISSRTWPAVNVSEPPVPAHRFFGRPYEGDHMVRLKLLALIDFTTE